MEAFENEETAREELKGEPHEDLVELTVGDVFKMLDQIHVMKAAERDANLRADASDKKARETVIENLELRALVKRYQETLESIEHDFPKTEAGMRARGALVA